MLGLFILIVDVLLGTAGVSGAVVEPCLMAERVCPNKYIKFFFYTRNTQDKPQELSLFDEEAVLKAPFIPGRPLIVLLHGYTGHKDYAPNPTIRPAYFQRGEYNVISLDYNPLVLNPCYFTAVQNLPVVANCTAQILDFLVANKKVEFDNIHVIGFSLGAQTSGMIANYLKAGKLKRITGLDPAKPMFITARPEYKLDKSDARFVDVIHTDVLQRGVLAPAGHIDFYVNGGVEQSGCIAEHPDDVGGCNHDRAPRYYAESVNSKVGFWGFKCAHWYLYALGVCHEEADASHTIMGYPVDETARGLYFLTTNSNSPYARGQVFASNNVIQMLDEKIQAETVVNKV